MRRVSVMAAVFARGFATLVAAVAIHSGPAAVMRSARAYVWRDSLQHRIQRPRGAEHLLTWLGDATPRS